MDKKTERKRVLGFKSWAVRAVGIIIATLSLISLLGLMWGLLLGILPGATLGSVIGAVIVFFAVALGGLIMAQT